ncbi:MFS transporter [Paracoccus tibetensis]|uniref:Predicted arabinose efflux permease, MFS family n=1 Tax=Paracoccus tibetensis TaxID=336292 RepID=A0A1G5EPK0_9RHOB|nr:MFS transporter [Paracoccus tibetensis]SCY28937.1 Predicted arabinose efflux permease, MFS family [Paracoccus tibetensis]
MPAVSAGIVSLVLAYVLSQFYRAFLAVMAPVLQADIGASPGDLALSSGLWFIAFALMQIPVGGWLDRFGPRRTVAWMLALGGAGGAAVFALASQPWHLHLSLSLLGIGCAPALMGSYYIIARNYPAARFGTLAGAVVGFGSLGNILGAAPLVGAAEAFGWRPTMWGLAVITLAVAALIGGTVRDPDRLSADSPQGTFSEILRLRALWFILPLFAVNYAASGAIRGLWAGPWLADVLDADARTIGNVALAMGLAMVVGNFLVGPAARLLGGLRRTILIFTAATCAVLAAMWLIPQPSLGTATLLLALVGLSGAAYPLLMAHGRSFLPPHLVGRGVTFLNMFSIGGVGAMQFASRPVFEASQSAYPAPQAYAMLWLFFLIPLVIGLVLYFRTPEAKHA